jgi:glycosyltransferase involved in cell wall biosynthesis
MKICHLTSVHPRFDTRIFLKECRSLAIAGHHVSLVVADGKGNEEKNNVHIYDVGTVQGRIKRILHSTKRVYEKAISLDADVYHLHDPELMPVGLKLKKKGKKVVFDAHEDLPEQILSKGYLNWFMRRLLSISAKIYENYACAKFDAVVAATPFIRDKFKAVNANTVDINNYPILEELATVEIDWSFKRNEVCYIGSITRVRGVHEITKAMQYAKKNTRLQLGGKFTELAFEQEVKNELGWRCVDELGWLDREGVAAVLKRSVAGLVTLHPIINYLDSLPVKMFEYMAAGVPVIASNFPLWQEIIERSDCGVCVDPMNPQSISEVIDFLVSNPDRAEKMGCNGRKAVNERYNWTIEEGKLLQLYSGFVQS